MLTITRIHNSVASTSNMRRICNLAADYSRKREVFGHKLQEHCLHMHTLAKYVFIQTTINFRIVKYSSIPLEFALPFKLALLKNVVFMHVFI